MNKGDLAGVEAPTVATKIVTGKRGRKSEEDKPTAKELTSAGSGSTKEPNPTSVRFTAGELKEIAELIDTIKKETGFRRCNKNSLIRAALQALKSKSPKQIVRYIKDLN